MWYVNAVRRANPVKREKTVSGGTGEVIGMVKKRPRKEVTLRYKKTQSMIKGGWYAVYAMEGIQLFSMV